LYTLQIFDHICFNDKASGEVFNIGPDEDYISIKELANLCANETSYNGEHKFMPPRPQEVKYATCSSDKIRKFFNYQTKVDIKEGIKKNLEYIKKRGVKNFRYNLPIEINNKLTPKTWSEKLI
jgi:Nucleoside-diphosphate-sugar epimerases